MKNGYINRILILIFVLVPVVALASDPVDKTKDEIMITSGDTGSEKTADLLDKEKPGAMAPVSTETEQAEEEIAEGKPIPDPLEPLNRVFFKFNDKLYFWLLKPVSKGYSALVPEWGRVRVRNIFHNITMPVRFVNSILQLKGNTAAREFTRFIVNSTVGVGGMFNIRWDNPEVKSIDEDLGQTLGFYGIGEGFYIVLPILGPSSLRDGVGLAGDYFLNPVSYITPQESELAVRSYDSVNDTSLTIGEYEDLIESAVDPYVSVRDAYTEHRRSKIKE